MAGSQPSNSGDPAFIQPLGQGKDTVIGRLQGSRPNNSSGFAPVSPAAEVKVAICLRHLTQRWQRNRTILVSLPVEPGRHGTTGQKRPPLPAPCHRSTIASEGARCSAIQRRGTQRGAAIARPRGRGSVLPGCPPHGAERGQRKLNFRRTQSTKAASAPTPGAPSPAEGQRRPRAAPRLSWVKKKNRKCSWETS